MLYPLEVDLVETLQGHPAQPHVEIVVDGGAEARVVVSPPALLRPLPDAFHYVLVWKPLVQRRVLAQKVDATLRVVLRSKNKINGDKINWTGFFLYKNK